MSFSVTFKLIKSFACCCCCYLINYNRSMAQLSGCCLRKRINVSKRLFAMLGIFAIAFVIVTIILKPITIEDTCCSPSYWDDLLDSNSLTGDQLIQYVKWTNHSSCQLSYDFGGVLDHMWSISGIDGQKSVCIDPKVTPERDNCLVYSFGISNEWSFDEEMEEYGCEIFSFDPSMGREQHDHSPGIHFYNWGLSDRDEILVDKNWTLRSLSSIYNNLTARHGHKDIDYLKIDIEFAEWIALPEIIESGMLSKVRQLGMEIHLYKNESIDKNRKYVQLLRSIERMGFVRFDSKYNPLSITNFTQLRLFSVPFAYEIAWYKI